MNKLFKKVVLPAGLVVGLGIVTVGCSEMEETGTEQSAKANKVEKVGTTKTFEEVDMTVNSVEQVAAPEFATEDGTFYKVSFTITNNNSEDAMFSTSDFKMQAGGQQFEESFDFMDGFDLDTINSGNTVEGNVYFVDTNNSQEEPTVQLRFSPFMLDTHKVDFK